jgi:hypothetical protein
MVSFANLKRSSVNLEGLTKMLDSSGNTRNFPDKSNYWKLTTDKAGNGFAVIRFLPAPFVDGDDAVPLVHYFEHAFKHPKTEKWYIEKSRTTLGEPDFINEYNSQLWKSGIEANKKFVSEFSKRKSKFVSNIYVIKDKLNPEAEGKVWLFEYGKKIQERIKSAISPAFEDDEAFDPFNLWEGANFNLKARKVDRQTNYDSSTWSQPCALLDDDEELEAIWKSEYSLLEIIDPKSFKSYDQLKKRAIFVLGLDETEDATPAPREAEEEKVVQTPAPKPSPKADPKPAPVVEDEDDEDLKYFSSILEDD